MSVELAVIVFFARFLIVSTSVDRGRSLARSYRLFGRSEVVTSIRAAVRALRSKPCAGMVLERELADGDGARFLTRLRALDAIRSELGALAATDAVMVLARPREVGSGLAFRSHEQFARVALAARFLHGRAAVLVAAKATELSLTAMQTCCLALEVAHLPRAEWADRLGGVGAASVRTHVRRVCVMAGAPSMRALAAPIVRAALAPERGSLGRAREADSPDGYLELEERLMVPRGARPRRRPRR